MRRSACVKERQNSCDDKSAETSLNLIQIKDVNLKCITDPSLLAAAEVTSVIPVLSQYTSIGRNREMTANDRLLHFQLPWLPSRRRRTVFPKD